MPRSPRKKLEWIEPRAVRIESCERQDRMTSRWARPLAASLLGLGMLVVFSATRDPIKDPPPHHNVARMVLIGSLLLAYMPSWLPRILPTAAVVFQDRIVHIVGMPPPVLMLNRIDWCEIAEIVTQDGPHPALFIHRGASEPYMIGVPFDLIPKVYAVLVELGVEVENRYAPELQTLS